jgi:hypothetical protein
MTPEDIQDAMQQYVSDAQTYLEAELSPVRAQATQYYRGDKFGNEEAGRSQFVSTDVRDTTLAMLPSLVRLFFPTSGHVLQYLARPKDAQHIDQAVAMADQATQVVNEIVLDQDNDGYSEGVGAFKDGLVRKIGTLKWWWEDRSVYKDYTADNMDVNQYDALAADPDVEITKETEHSVEGITFYDVHYRHWRRDGIAMIRCVPPEEMLISRDARNLEDASFIGHRTEKTRSELIAMGVPEAEINQWGGQSSEIRQSIEEIARRGGIAHVNQAATPAEERNLWIEGYPYLDLDGDGVSELVRVRCLGTSFHVIGDPEPVDERPFAIFCPDPEPHVLIGNSVADRVMDLQLMKSSVIRAAADGLSDSIFPPTYYMEGVVDRQAMESTAIGQRIAVRDGIQPSQAVLEMSHEWKGQDALAMLGYLDTVKQQRTGPLPSTLDPDSLQSTPEVGVKATVQAASEQLELIARNFVGPMKRLGKGLLKLLVEHQPRKRIVRLRNQYVEVDPKAWDAEMDVSVTVAIGTSEKLGVLAATAQKQEAALQLLGPSNPLVTVGQLRHTYATMLELQGIKDVGKYWNDLPTDWQPPPQPQQPDPNMVLAQAEMQKAQASLAKQQADFQIAQVKAQQEMADLRAQLLSKQADLELRREEMHLVDERERDKAEADVAVKVAATNAQFGSQITIAQIQADIAREKLDVERERTLKLETSNAD